MTIKQKTINTIFKNYQNIAIVGLSNKLEKPSYQVAQYMQQQGYKIIPINPNHTQVLNETCYPNLTSVPIEVDIVTIFQRSDKVPPIVDDAISIGAKVIWMQLAIIHNQAAQKAEQHQLITIMDKCIKIEHQRIKNSLSF